MDLNSESDLAHAKSFFLDCQIMKVEEVGTYLYGMHAYKLFRESALSTTAHVYIFYNTRENDRAQPSFRRLLLFSALCRMSALECDTLSNMGFCIYQNLEKISQMSFTASLF